jgi:predicted RNase H-like HicB family nuclease
MLPGVITEGDTLKEARARVKEAIRGYLKVLRKHNEPIPRERGAEFERPITERVAVTV